MIRVVLDTNVVVSAHIRPAGIPARILLLAFAKEFELCVSSEIVAEYDEVLRRPKFKIDSHVVDEFLQTLSITAVAISPATQIRAAADPDGDKFLVCALEAEADYLVTGNLKDYPTTTALSGGDPAESIIGTQIVSPREFLSIIAL